MGLLCAPAPWPYCLIAFTICLLIFQGFPPASNIYSYIIPLKLQGFPTDHILRPGDYIDPTRYRLYPEPKEGPSYLDVERTGVARDARYGFCIYYH